MSRLQMLPNSYPSHAFLEKEVLLETFPPLQRQRYSYSSPPHLNIPKDKERQRAAMNDCQQIWPFKKSSDSILRKHSADNVRRKMDIDEQDEKVLTGNSKIDDIFPLKPVLHKRAFNLSNCQADNFVQKDRKRPDIYFPSSSQDKQISRRRQEKKDQRKLELLDNEYHPRFQESNGISPSGYQILHGDQHRLYENQIKLTKEIHKKEIVLQEKLLKTEEKLRKVQLRPEFEVKMKREVKYTNKDMATAENMLDCTNEGIWNWESTTQRAIAGRREEVQRDRFQDWARDNKNDMDGWKKKPGEMNTGQRGRREEIEWENRRRNTQRTINCKGQEKECSNFEEELRHKWKMAREEDKTKREMALEWARHEIKEQAQKNWQKARVYEAEMKRGERLKAKRDTEIDDEVEQWNKLDRLKSNYHVKQKASSKFAQMTGPTADQWPTVERLNQYSNWPTENDDDEPLPEAAYHNPSLNQKGKRLQQVELSPERSPEADVPLVPCNICHRFFAQDRLEKHSRICEKMQLSKRKIFDSSRYRAKGTDLEAFIKMNGRCITPEPKKNNWRQKHEALIWNVRQARVPAPGGFQSRPSADLNPDYVTCPHCGRRFAPGPAERHVPKCQNIRNRPPPPRHR